MNKRSEELALLGANIRALRQAKGLSQERLATLVGLHRTYIGGIERGERNPSFLNLLKLARTLEVTPSDLVAGLS